MMAPCPRILALVGWTAAFAVLAALVPLVFLLGLDFTAPGLQTEQLASGVDRLTPEPKTVVTLPGGHILAGRQDGVDAMLVTVRQWLNKMSAINTTEDEAVASTARRREK